MDFRKSINAGYGIPWIKAVICKAVDDFVLFKGPEKDKENDYKKTAPWKTGPTSLTPITLWNTNLE